MRYCAGNGLNRLGTLTYRDSCTDPGQIRSDLVFFRDLRGKLGGKPFPYAWVPEWHPGERAVELHVSALLARLGVSSRAAIVATVLTPAI